MFDGGGNDVCHYFLLSRGIMWEFVRRVALGEGRAGALPSMYVPKVRAIRHPSLPYVFVIILLHPLTQECRKELYDCV